MEGHLKDITKILKKIVMKKKHQYLLSLLGIICLTAILFSFKLTPTKVKYQYITIIVQHHDFITVSIDGRDFHQVKVAKEARGDFDMNPTLNMIHQYEDEGYELQSFSGNGLFNYFWLRKEK